VKIRLCVDCVYADANGTAELDESWLGFEDRWEGWGFSPETERIGDYHEIREPRYSSVPCDGCGSGLHGDRYDYEAYPIRKDAGWTA